MFNPLLKSLIKSTEFRKCFIGNHKFGKQNSNSQRKLKKDYLNKKLNCNIYILFFARI